MRFIFMLLVFLCIVPKMYASNKKVEAITNFKAELYVGNWYEIARIPFYFEKDCIAPIIANYALDDDGLSVINSCKNRDGTVSNSLGEATFVESSNIAKLQVTFVPKWMRFTHIGRGDYWIMYTDYQYSLVGSPDHKYLWILSRSEVVDANKIIALLNIARDHGFDVKHLEFNYNLDKQVMDYIKKQ